MDITAARKAFEQIRDIPYRIPLSLSEEDHCCSGKHILLKARLETLGYTIRHRVCSFEWSSLSLPQEVMHVPHENPSTHSYLEFLHNGAWIPVDATWDTGISHILPVNNWDGMSATPIAVPVTSVFSPEKSTDIMTNENDQEILEDLAKNGNFYEKFNNWLQDSRNL